MIESIPSFNNCIELARYKGISEDTLKYELVELIKENSSYIKSMKILIERLNNNEKTSQYYMEGVL